MLGDGQERHAGRLNGKTWMILELADPMGIGTQQVRVRSSAPRTVRTRTQAPAGTPYRKGGVSEQVVDHETLAVCGPWSAYLPATRPMERTGGDGQNPIEYE